LWGIFVLRLGFECFSPFLFSLVPFYEAVLRRRDAELRPLSIFGFSRRSFFLFGVMSIIRGPRPGVLKNIPLPPPPLSPQEVSDPCSHCPSIEGLP